MNHYVSIFKNSKFGKIIRYGGGRAWAAGQYHGRLLRARGQQFAASNGGPQLSFSAPFDPTSGKPLFDLDP
jgi:predicted 3-demethylubiquinone-9 3-methyltransferase (glyoxalase superfamily)